MSKKIITKIQRAINDFKMIEENDKICVGISGGKDSITLAYTLKQLSKFYPIKFEMIGVHLEMGFPNMDFSEIRSFFVKEEIEFHEKPTKVYEILKKNLNSDGSLKCSICSRFKKALVIEAAKEYGCNKVAFAHHGDDAIETLWLNAVYGGKLATFRPKMYMSKSDIDFIRPLIYLRETEIESYVSQNSLPVVISTCPNDKHTQREAIKQLLEKIYEEYPAAYENFLIMLGNEKQLDLWRLPDQES